LGEGLLEKIAYALGCFLDVVLPRPDICTSCGRVLKEYNKFLLCEACLLQIRLVDSNSHTDKCFKSIDNVAVCFDNNYSVCLYEGLPRELIHKLKYKDKREIAFTMAAMIYEVVMNNKVRFDYIVPVPISKKRLRKRGYNHAELIGKELSNIAQINIINTLERTKNTSTQVLLSMGERWYNVKGVFKNSSDLTDKSVLLIDDVITTGATAHYCAEELKASGAKNVTVITFARSII
jgi:competence protein ComFC